MVAGSRATSGRSTRFGPTPVTCTWETPRSRYQVASQFVRAMTASARRYRARSLAVQCARERLRSTDGRQRLLRDDDAHAESLGGAVDNRRGSLGVRPTSRVAFFG